MRVACESLWKRLGLALMFVLMAGTGFTAYAGYGRMAGHGGETPSRSRRLTRPVVATHDRAASSADPWLGKATRLASVIAFLVLGDAAKALPPER